MMKYLKNNSAVTIVEVLVAIILTAIVMLHGTVFFVATWRLSAESKDYSLVLGDVVSNLENYLSRQNGGAPSEREVKSADYIQKTDSKRLRGLYKVTYTLTKVDEKPDHTKITDDGFWYIISEATWKYAGTEADVRKISIKSACAITGTWH